MSCLYKTIYKTHFQSLTIWFTNNMCSKEMICIRRGIHLYAATFSMTLPFLLLAFFLFTRNLRIDKNYTLSIFMLSGSIQFYSNFPIKLDMHLSKNHVFYIKLYSCLFISHAFTLKIIDHINICIFTCNKSYHNSIHEIQTYTLEDVFSLQIPFTLIKFVISLCLCNSHS